MNLLAALTGVFRSAMREAFPELPSDAPCPVTVSAKEADYQFNGAMAIAGLLKKATGNKVVPRDVANKIVERVPKDSGLVERLEVVNPGFVNIFVKLSFVELALTAVLRAGVTPPRPEEGTKRIVVDYSSPNIAKEMHVGHLRSTIIGDSIANLLEFLGHDVLRVNHIGDWGTQFGMLIAHLKDIFPDYAAKSPPIGDLMAFYKESKRRFDEDEAFKKRAYECVVLLQSGDPDHIKAWKLICDVSRKDFEKVRLHFPIFVSFFNRCIAFFISGVQTSGNQEPGGAWRVLLPGEDELRGQAVAVQGTARRGRGEEDYVWRQRTSKEEEDH